MSDLFDKPFALSIGPQGCGEKRLHDYFSLRGDVALPNVREIFFFDRHFQRGAEFYKSHFEISEKHKIAMEISTTAFDNPLAPQRVYDLLGPDVKLFCPLRDPAARSYAVYQEYLKYGIVTGGIEEACEQAPQILFSSNYSRHLEVWQTRFENIHFVLYEELDEDFEKVLGRLCAYLELEHRPYRPRNSLISHLKLKKPSKSRASEAKDLAWLQNRLQSESHQFHEIIN